MVVPFELFFLFLRDSKKQITTTAAVNLRVITRTVTVMVMVTTTISGTTSRRTVAIAVVVRPPSWRAAVVGSTRR